MNEFYKGYIKDSLSLISFEKNTLYSLYNLERIINNTKLFDEKFNTQKYIDIEKMSDYLWGNLYLRCEDSSIEKKMSKIVELIPDSDLQGGITSNLLVNILVCLDVSYKSFIKKQNLSYMTGLYVYDSIKQIILYDSKDIKFITNEVVEEINNSSIILKEIEHQRLIFNFLKHMKITSNNVKSFRKVANENKINLNDLNR